MTIGEKIKQLRKDKGMTQKELAVLSGISVTSIQYYESGKFTPKIEQVQKIAKAMNIPEMEMLPTYWDSTIDVDAIQNELKFMDLVRSLYGDVVEKMLTNYFSLNEQGKRKAEEYITDLSEQSKYQNQEQE